ncbi:MAG: class I SAM-dependent methyltransferase [Sphingomonadaceae bacterium]|nr:class I SAM-dependent methyltransferase [Sphingomonadaceae bacterium]
MATVTKLKKFFGKKAKRPARPDADGVTYRPLRPLDERIDSWRVAIDDDRQRAMYDRVAATVDGDAYAALQQKYRDEVEVSDELAVTKYLDLAPWFMIHSRLARLLDIDKRARCSILDIGAGGGQFLAIAKAHGHEVLAFDQPHPPVYGDLLKLFEIPRIEGSVKLGEKLPEEIGRYDLVVINGQVFDVQPNDRTQRWDVPQWASFIEYLCDEHLTYPGTLFIGLNKSAGPTGVEDFLWPLVDLAESHGAAVERKRATMVFDLTEPLRFDEVDYEPWREIGTR